MVTAVILKRFFREQFNIPVMARCAKPEKGGWADVYIPHRRVMKNGREDHMAPLQHDHEFPEDLRRRCLGIVYGPESKTGQQAFGGNIQSFSLAMFQTQWDELLRSYDFVTT
jgi:hypothetical protein